MEGSLVVHFQLHLVPAYLTTILLCPMDVHVDAQVFLLLFMVAIPRILDGHHGCGMECHE